MKQYSPSQISAISRLFSSSVIRELARFGKSPVFARLAKQAISPSRALATGKVCSFFDAAFEVLKRTDCRHEYIYKAALTHKVLLGTHSLQTASMLNEFRVGECKADVSILNGTATVYEIKSERDSLSRLEKQIETYKKFYAKVYVIAGENHIEGVRSLVTADVGILKLSNRHQISTVREAEDRPERTSPLTILDSIRTDEAIRILVLVGELAPDVPNTKMRAVLRERFSNLNSRDVHAAMVQVLKKTRDLLPLSTLVQSMPTSLQSVALTIPLRRGDHTRLLDALKTPMRDALEWG
jgi:hypothetical protein